MNNFNDFLIRLIFKLFYITIKNIKFIKFKLFKHSYLYIIILGYIYFYIEIIKLRKINMEVTFFSFIQNYFLCNIYFDDRKLGYISKIIVYTFSSI